MTMECHKCHEVGHFARDCKGNYLRKLSVIDIHESRTTSLQYIYKVSNIKLRTPFCLAGFKIFGNSR